MLAEWGVADGGANPVESFVLTLLWLAMSVGALWIHTARWLTDGPLGRRVSEETTRTFVLEIPQGVAGSIGWVGVPAGALLTSLRVLEVAGVETSPAMAASAGVAALVTFLVWHSGRKHRWVLPTMPRPEAGSSGLSRQAESPPAGWYTDTQDPAVLRFWDGRSWTSSRVPRTPLSWPVEPTDIHGGSLDGFGAVTSGFRHSFTYRGRASRSAFWWFQLAVGLTWFALAALTFWAVSTRTGPGVDTAHNHLGVWVLVVACAVALVVYLVPTIALTVRRLHDINQAGWWALICIIPGGLLALLVLMVLPGTPGPNRFDLPDGWRAAVARQ